MKTRNGFWVVSILAALLVGCDDFIAEDVSDKKLVIQAPADQVTVPSPEITFWWDALEVNTAYRLQVVIPSFEQTSLLVLDTLVDTHQIATVLEAGQYAWRVRAENGTYQGAFSVPSEFIVISTTELSPTEGDSRSTNSTTE